MISEEIENWIVSEEEAGERLDKLLTTHFSHYSRTYFQYLIESKLVLIDGKPAKKRTLLCPGNEIEVKFVLTPEIALEPEAIPLDIVYEDEWLLAVNKPAGMVVHPATGNWSGTFVNALLYHCKHLEKGNTLRPGIVHRLDKDTSGILVAAKTEHMQQRLVELFATRKVEKQYLAICVGNPGSRMIEGMIGRHPTRRKEMAIVNSGGKEAMTRCELLSYNRHLSFISLYPLTGRTHQLRVHLKSVGAPILGDSLYGSLSANKSYGAHRQLLHANTLRFIHPITKEPIEFTARIPVDLQSFIKLLDY